jgi:peroxiredoxin (alkyl hydroperoxide reductase subunit C)
MEDFEMMPMVSMRIGDTLPELELDAFYQGEEKKINIDDYEGKWKIFFFYPADFTFVCPTELEELTDNYEDFKKEGAEIFSVSTDTVFVHKAWKDTSKAIAKVEFPMVADPTGELCDLFGTYIYDEGLSLRGTFIIDPDGKLVAMEINDNSIGRSAKELLRKLRAAKFVYEHGDKVCPASWEPGDDTLEPGMDLVGKI